MLPVHNGENIQARAIIQNINEAARIRESRRRTMLACTLMLVTVSLMG
jgi:hypothetical protein